MADFGLTEDMYGTKYFRRTKSESGSEEKVPIRWMAPESIENDIYNQSTDVVRLIIVDFDNIINIVATQSAQSLSSTIIHECHN